MTEARTRRRTILAVTVAVLALSACGSDPAPGDSPTGTLGDATTTTTPAPTDIAAAPSATSGVDTPVEHMPASWKLCQNPLRGSSMGYPGEWFTTSLGANDKCSLFHETSFTIPVNSELPLVAMSAIQHDMDLATFIGQVTTPTEATTTLKENTTIAGLTAVRFETVSVQAGLYDVGTRHYGYAIERGSRTFVLSTLGVPGEARYDSWKFVIDVAKGTLRFL